MEGIAPRRHTGFPVPMHFQAKSAAVNSRHPRERGAVGQTALKTGKREYRRKRTDTFSFRGMWRRKAQPWTAARGMLLHR